MDIVDLEAYTDANPVEDDPIGQLLAINMGSQSRHNFEKHRKLEQLRGKKKAGPPSNPVVHLSPEKTRILSQEEVLPSTALLHDVPRGSRIRSPVSAATPPNRKASQKKSKTTDLDVAKAPTKTYERRHRSTSQKLLTQYELQPANWKP